MRYWIHRIGRGVEGLYALHFDALWDLLQQKNLLTIGWQCFIDNDEIVQAIESDDQKSLAQLKIRDVLRNFAQMTVGDIVLVLPIPEYEDRVFSVRIKSQHARSILRVKDQSSFVTNIFDGRKIDFDPKIGFHYENFSPVDAGFFHEVDILKRIDRAQLHPALKIVCDNVLSTNQSVTKPSIQKLIPQ